MSIYKLFSRYFLPVFICMLFSCKPKQAPKNPVAPGTKLKAELAKPKPSGLVNDYPGIFSIEEFDSLDSLCNSIEKDPGKQVALVTLYSAELGQQDAKAYAAALGNAWGVGAKGKNNGIMIVLCIQKSEIGISVGEGITKIITDEATQSVIDHSFLPSFRKGKYYRGCLKGIMAIEQLLRYKS